MDEINVSFNIEKYRFSLIVRRRDSEAFLSMQIGSKSVLIPLTWSQAEIMLSNFWPGKMGIFARWKREARGFVYKPRLCEVHYSMAMACELCNIAELSSLFCDEHWRIFRNCNHCSLQ